MFDLAAFNQWGSLAAIGVLAGAVAGYWSHVRGFFSYISGLMVISVDVCSNSQSLIVFSFIRNNFKSVEPGHWKSISAFLPITYWNNCELVSFKKFGGSSVLFLRMRPFSLLLAKENGYHLKLYTVRGLCNFEKLIVEAQEWSKERWSKDADSSDSGRYFYKRILGSANEKHDMEYARSRGKTEGKEESIQPNADSQSLFSSIDINVDSSFTHTSDSYRNLEQKKKPFSDIFAEPNVIEAIKRAHRWYKRQDWYMERGIPWRLGFLFHGPGGTGKSVCAKRIAHELKIPIYHYYLNTLTDREFMNAWEEMDLPCVVLFEDFDNVFHGRTPQTDHKLLSFDCVLNTLSGVNSPSGVLLIVTTNEIDKLDPAMGVESDEFKEVSTRPGRIDKTIEFTFMSEDNRRKMATNILRDWPDLIEDVVRDSEGMTPAQVQEFCVQKAFNKIEEEENVASNIVQIESYRHVVESRPTEKAEAVVSQD